MFDDGFDAHGVMGLQESSDSYQAWEEKMEQQMATPMEAAGSSTEVELARTLVVLEIGCGVRVPSVRQECLDVVVDTAKRCRQKGIQETCCTYIRINPEDHEIQLPEDTLGIQTISIQGSALSVLLAIEAAKSSLV